MIGAHNVAVSKGIELDSDEYFSEVERVLGIDAQRNNRYVEPDADEEEALSEAAKPTQRRSSPPSAPVSRSGSAPGTSPRVIRLTKEQAEVAALNKMTEKEYWDQLQRARKSGEITH